VTERQAPSALFKPWIGKKCSDIVRHEYSWQFSFPPAGSVTIESFWRITLDHRVVLCSFDDGKKFDLPEHVDAAQAAKELIFDEVVQAVRVNDNGDLIVSFENEANLEILINSRMYESWNAASWSESKKLLIVATGGGALTIFEDGQT